MFIKILLHYTYYDIYPIYKLYNYNKYDNIWNYCNKYKCSQQQKTDKSCPSENTAINK